jgi:ATP-dependent DNA helicase RecG
VSASPHPTAWLDWGVATVADLRERLRRPLERELQTGCRDTVVVGGLERLVATVGRPFRDLTAVLGGYADLDPETRRERVERALAMLDASQPRSGDGAAASAARRPPSVPEPGAAAAGELLDAPLASRRVDIGAHAPRKLRELGLETYRDLLEHAPRRWEDRRTLPSFEAIEALEQATVSGVVRGRKAIPTRRGLSVLRVVLEDSDGRRLAAVWFNQPWLEQQLFPGQRLIVTGRVRRRGAQLELHVTGHEVDDGGPSLSTGRIVGIYPTVHGTSQAYLRQALDTLLRAVPVVPDPLPARLRRELELVDVDRAWRDLHQPPDEAALAAARARLVFEEYLLLELRVLLQREGDALGRSLAVPDADLERFGAALPFALTAAQERAIAAIRADMASERQMARLLQGDVGSGKTAVAAAAVWMAVRSGAQAALMAPTEILARQHFINLQTLLWPLGVRCDLLIGNGGSAARREARARVAAGATDLAVGTHALIQEGVRFADLGLAVIDEEHRFGVEQRRALISGAPDVLVMSATPIPRSLALTAYGDLDLTVIDELPPGRTPVATQLRRAGERTAVYREALQDVRNGHQVYVVAPLIDDSEALDEVVSATRLADDLRAIWGDEVRLGLLHGRMAGPEKEAVMNAFRAHQLDVLVSTTVIEVGVDIPNASVMLVENAERFGLAQLHQLRGRVGRGSAASRCVLIAGDASRATMQRLRVVERHADGFVIAEKDLELRGPGELRGTRQSGLPDLRFGDLARDVEVIERARETAQRILAADPRLEATWASGLRAALVRQQRAAGFRETL